MPWFNNLSSLNRGTKVSEFNCSSMVFAFGAPPEEKYLESLLKTKVTYRI